MNVETRRELNAKIERAAKTLAPIFEANEWVWGWGTNKHIPSEEEIKNKLHKLANYAEDHLAKEGNDHTRVSTGRLAVGFYFGSWQIDLELETVNA